MDPAVMFAFAIALMETAKTVAAHQPSHAWPDGCIALANRAADLFERALAIQEEEKRNRYIWTVWLVSEGTSKIHCIKTLREFTRLGLKEARDLVESCPCALLETEDEGLAREMYEQFIRDPGYANFVKPTVELRKTAHLEKQRIVEPSPEDCCCPLPSCPDEYPG